MLHAVAAVGLLDVPVRAEAVRAELVLDEPVLDGLVVAGAGASRPHVSQKPSSSIVPAHPERGHPAITRSSCPATLAGTD
jgi:hypothetical protein